MKKSYQKNNKQKQILISIAMLLFLMFPAKSALASEITPENVTYLINKERIYYGLTPLKVDTDLNRAAKLKSKDMLNRNYFEHYAFGLAPWDFINLAGYNYLYAGENLAMDFQTAEGMVNAWMNSPMHKKNILSEDYDEIGLGVVKGAYLENGEARDTIMVSNMFGRKKPAILVFFDNLANGFQSLFDW